MTSNTMNTKYLEDLPEVKTLANFLETTLSSTYPTKTLKRRIKLLTNTEYQRCRKHYQEIISRFEKIEDIIATRAELEGDKWP